MKCYKCGDLAWIRDQKQNSRMKAECELCRRPLCGLHAKYSSKARITNDGLHILPLYCNYCFNLFHEKSTDPSNGERIAI